MRFGHSHWSRYKYAFMYRLCRLSLVLTWEWDSTVSALPSPPCLALMLTERKKKECCGRGGCHTSPPLQGTDTTLKRETAKSQKLEYYTQIHWYTTPWQWLQMLRHNRGRGVQRVSQTYEKIGKEWSSILRSEGKSPLVLVLLEQLGLTHEYFILLMFKSHHLW